MNLKSRCPVSIAVNSTPCLSRGDFVDQINAGVLNISRHLTLIRDVINAEHESGHATKRFRTDGYVVASTTILPASAGAIIDMCKARDRSAICSILESIPLKDWTIIPGRASAQIDSVNIQVWHQSGGSGINTYETVTVQLFSEEEELTYFQDTFTADELRLPNYIPKEQRC